ncbi:hypothetical protein POTOM_053304 [Populus tomentosa]|uniref:Uncharacterized protein n=1 Tax=Populus tomentosa TaxID=118781 RepID=A0A8X7XX83_POPTO|nr:hypothetical protein POTOM_053304 [Populus tomentosa]
MNQEEDLVDNSHDEQILECGSESQKLSILQIFGCHITRLSLLLIERSYMYCRIEESEVLLSGLFLSKHVKG